MNEMVSFLYLEYMNGYCFHAEEIYVWGVFFLAPFTPLYPILPQVTTHETCDLEPLTPCIKICFEPRVFISNLLPCMI